ncbi:beta/gamma crystallin family protein [Bradyrhizobium sp. IC3069]|uniref:beta/gamma crystallin family protein n=1 Tax=unclassified Bradyrhizobium TaxID=2631580 RepID=UPI001CD73CDD|nr:MULTISPECIES: beta/gamma crystallin family protein [unclassified Bradyrhizobium]MCA1360580.1 beta/gamma crystallin family protein [Bradyrhizobium sp. IC4059]MCA1517071.1 beta/gamma crystallin family protein [Bradyrhizobium sp. IC3069]
MAECVIFEDRNFDGAAYQTFGDIRSLKNVPKGMGGLGNWSDETSSIRIMSGTWRFFEHVDFGGQSWVLGPGDYPWVPDQGIPDNSISSIQKISD